MQEKPNNNSKLENRRFEEKVNFEGNFEDVESKLIELVDSDFERSIKNDEKPFTSRQSEIFRNRVKDGLDNWSDKIENTKSREVNRAKLAFIMSASYFRKFEQNNLIAPNLLSDIIDNDEYSLLSFPESYITESEVKEFIGKYLKYE